MVEVLLKATGALSGSPAAKFSPTSSSVSDYNTVADRRINIDEYIMYIPLI